MCTKFGYNIVFRLNAIAVTNRKTNLRVRFFRIQHFPHTRGGGSHVTAIKGGVEFLHAKNLRVLAFSPVASNDVA